MRSGNECFDIVVQSLEVGAKLCGPIGLYVADPFVVLLRVDWSGDLKVFDQNFEVVFEKAIREADGLFRVFVVVADVAQEPSKGIGGIE